MVPHTRRRLLHGAAAAALGGLAGCQGSSTSSTGSNDLRRAENVEMDPESHALRHPENAPVAWFETGETTDQPPGTTTPEPYVSDRERGLIADAETADRLRFAEVDGVEAARSFVDATDFEAETLLLESRIVDECYRLELCAITWSADSYHTYYGRAYRPVDVACRTDADDRVARLIRIPDVVDPDEIRGRGSGTSSGNCQKFRERVERRVSEADR